VETIFDSGPGRNRTLKTVIGRDGRRSKRNYGREGSNRLTGKAGGITLALHGLGSVHELSEAQRAGAVTQVRTMCDFVLGELGEDIDDGSFKKGEVVRIEHDKMATFGIVVSERTNTITILNIDVRGNFSKRRMSKEGDIVSYDGFSGRKGLILILLEMGFVRRITNALKNFEGDDAFLEMVVRSNFGTYKQAQCMAAKLIQDPDLIRTLARELEGEVPDTLFAKLDPVADQALMRERVMDTGRVKPSNAWWRIHGLVDDPTVAIKSIQKRMNAVNPHNRKHQWNSFHDVLQYICFGEDCSPSEASCAMVWYTNLQEGGPKFPADETYIGVISKGADTLCEHPVPGMAKLGRTIRARLPLT
jgi:hypothetical protein